MKNMHFFKGYSSAKRPKKEEPPPQKLMDDLFLKTKATPSIYWQPLSPEEVSRIYCFRSFRLFHIMTYNFKIRSKIIG